MHQLPLQPPKYRACAITGHRTLPSDFSQQRTESILRDLICSGVEIFYNGLAMGFDLATAEAILALKKEYPHVRLHGCIPFYGQEKYFSAEDKARYHAVLAACDETTVFDERYHPNSYFKRNDFMVDNSDVLFAYCVEASGGAAYTVRRFKKRKGEENIRFY